MRASPTALLAATLTLTGCYLTDPVAPPPPSSLHTSPGSQSPIDLSGFDELDADQLFGAAADEAVPSDILRAIAWTESGLATVDGGWLNLSADRIARGAFLTGLSQERIRAEPGANLVAGAALLAELREDIAPEAHPAEIDATWWPVLTAWSDTGESWLDDAFALDVFGAIQRGVISPTDRIEDEYMLIAPQLVPGLDLITPVAGPGGLSAYPGAMSLGATAPPRASEVERIELVSAERSWARALSTTPSGHYVVRTSDGRIAEQVSDELRAGAPGAVTIVMTGGVASPGSWTVQALEGSARLASWTARRHDIPIDAEHIRGELGPHFPWTPWLQMVDCFANQSPGCDSGLAGGVDAQLWPEDVVEEEYGGSRESPPSVPYFYQYANNIHASASCQNTSIAMVLKWLGWSGTPDTITSRFGKDLAQSPAGLAQVFNTLASEAGLDARLIAHTDGSIAGLNALLDAGKPTIVHGYQTGYGHVAVALGRDGSDYIVNDPAGRWAERFKGGYPYGWNSGVGKSIRYPQGAFEAAISTSNGSTYLPLWYHELTGADVPTSSEEPDDSPPASEPDWSSDDPDGPSEAPEPGPVGSGSHAFYDWADVVWVRPSQGDTVPNPVVMEAERTGGERIEFLAGSYLVGSSASNPALTSREFYQLGTRTLTARNTSRWGTVLAVSSLVVEVTEHHTTECSVIGTLSCGETVSGDNGSTLASDVIDGYPDVVGNWSGPEMAWTWSGGAGEVTVRLVDPQASELNHDIMVLRQSAGVCVAPDWVAIGWNNLTFSPEPGAAYTFVVDSHGDVGEFELQLECGS